MAPDQDVSAPQRSLHDTVTYFLVTQSAGPACVGLMLGAPPDALHFAPDDIWVPAGPGTSFILASAQAWPHLPLLDLDAVWSMHRQRAGQAAKAERLNPGPVNPLIPSPQKD